MAIKFDFARAIHMLCIPLVACNAFMIFAGTWSLSSPTESAFDIVLEVMVIVTIALNMFFAVAGQVFLNHRKNRRASRLQWYFSAYLVGTCLMIIANIFVTLTATLGFGGTSTAYGTSLTIALILNALVHVFPILAGTGIYKLTLSRVEPERDGDAASVIWSRAPIRDDPSWDFEPSWRKFLKGIGVGFIFLAFALAVVAPSIFFPGGRDALSFIAGDVATTMLFALVPCTLMLVRHVPRTRGRGTRIIAASIIVAGCVLAGINALPLVQTSSTITSLDAQFAATYGSGWQATIPSSATNQPYRVIPVSITDILFTIPLEPVELRTDITYMVDRGLALKFDWYAPEGTTGSSIMLPLVVAIHGGSWELYDKGVYNIIPTSKYLANLGYIVADVQYGLYDENDPTPFSLKDMVMEIANLTRFLAADTNQFHADVSRTFFLGRSAGAHLALVCGLGHDNPYFAGNYSVGFDCAGIVPFYPPTNMSRWYGNTTDSVEFFGVPFVQFQYFNPIDLVSSSSPPVLCFQGLADKLVPPTQARQLDATMGNFGRTCILGEFPYAGHAFDIFYNYQYNQVCLYYTERFLALNII